MRTNVILLNIPEENDEYSNNSHPWKCNDNLKVPHLSYNRGHRRNISENISSFMLPRYSDSNFFDDMSFPDTELKRYHSSANCSVSDCKYFSPQLIIN